MTEPHVDAAGWALPDRQQVAHYFVGRASLCRQWKYSGNTVPGVPISLACRACEKELKRDHDAD